MTDLEVVKRIHAQARRDYLKDKLKSLVLLGIVTAWWLGVFWVLCERLDR